MSFELGLRVVPCFLSAFLGVEVRSTCLEFLKCAYIQAKSVCETSHILEHSLYSSSAMKRIHICVCFCVCTYCCGVDAANESNDRALLFNPSNTFISHVYHLEGIAHTIKYRCICPTQEFQDHNR